MHDPVVHAVFNWSVWDDDAKKAYHHFLTLRWFKEEYYLDVEANFLFPQWQNHGLQEQLTK
jgi:hypothetical protein